MSKLSFLKCTLLQALLIDKVRRLHLLELFYQIGGLYTFPHLAVGISWSSFSLVANTLDCYIYHFSHLLLVKLYYVQSVSHSHFVCLYLKVLPGVVE